MAPVPVFQVSVLHTKRDFFDYLLAEGMPHPAIGTGVWVPFRKGLRFGVIVGERVLEEEVLDSQGFVAIRSSDASSLTLCNSHSPRSCDLASPMLFSPRSRGLSAGSSDADRSLDPADKPRDVGRERSRDIGRERSRDIGRERSRDIGRERSRDIGRERSRDKGEERSHDKGGKRSHDVGEKRSHAVGERKLKSIYELAELKPLLEPALLSLCQWISQYYQTPLSEVLPLALPKKLRSEPSISLPFEFLYTLKKPYLEAQNLLPKRALKQRALLDFLNNAKAGVLKKDLQAQGFTQAHLQALEALECIEKKETIDLSAYENSGNEAPLALNEEQALALESIRKKGDQYHCFLLQGVTGSGKTEVYLQLIADVLERGRQALVLVPEIGLTPQLLARFAARFKEPMAVLHSNLSERARAEVWLLAQEGHIKLVIGTRAAIFTPMPDLGLIIIDEEHDASLKQMEGVRYFARDTALVRALQSNIPIVLGSATPSLESLYNCSLQKYSKLQLRQKALDSAPLFYQIVDLRKQGLKEGLSPASIKTIGSHLQAGKQVLVFINRRGYAPVLICHACGWMADCKACDAHLTLHKPSNTLQCHHCGRKQGLPNVCQQCQARELLPLGTGTQRIYECLHKEFPSAKILRIDRDEVRKKDELAASLQKIERGEAELIIGTQMLAKGHHFPNVTLVVVVNADAGFYNQDFRALEQLGQLLTQVAGRAGRAENPGQVLIQTHLPGHPLLNLLIQQGYEAFSSALLHHREQALLPPYYHLALIRAEDRKIDKIMALLQAMKVQLQAWSLEVLGPAPAPLSRKANQYRMQLLLKSPKRKPLQAALKALRDWMEEQKIAGTVRWNVDVDPQDLS